MLGLKSGGGSGARGRGLIIGIVVFTVYRHGFWHYKSRLNHSVW